VGDPTPESRIDGSIGSAPRGPEQELHAIHARQEKFTRDESDHIGAACACVVADYVFSTI
jgi:hypothetical protein